jgi:hypothetical protein
MHTYLFITLKTQNLHAIPTNTIMRENLANKALDPENPKIHHQVGPRNIPYPDTPTKVLLG